MSECELILGNCLKKLREIPDKSVDLVLTDPPYNIGIAEWDKIKDYHQWLCSVFIECERVLKKNGTFWFFHTRFSDLAILHDLIVKNTTFRHKQLIVIDKGIQSAAGRTSDKLRSFPNVTEYLQFYTFEDLTGAEQLTDEIATKNPFALYLRSEFDKAKVSNKEIAKLFPSKTGNMTGCVSNWLLGYNVPLKEQYLKMREFLNNEYLRKEYEYLRKEYEYLRKEYEELRKEYEELRYPFNLPLGVTDVWKINFYSKKHELSENHPTQKPLKIIRRIIETASVENVVVLDPFMGSGTTGVACVELGRKFIGIEISPEYFEIAKKRIEEVGKQSRLVQSNSFNKAVGLK